MFWICLRSTSAKSFRHAVEFIINGLHFLHFDIHADVIDPMLSVSHSELEFALSTNDWLNHVDKVVLLENPNKFSCSFQWQVPSPSSFTVTPMTGTIKPASSLDAVIRWTQDKEEIGNPSTLKYHLEHLAQHQLTFSGILPKLCFSCDSCSVCFQCMQKCAHTECQAYPQLCMHAEKQESQLVLRINGGVTSRSVTVQGVPPEGLVRWKAPKLHVGSVPVGLPVTTTAFIMNKGVMDSVVRVMSSPNIECTPLNSLIAFGDVIPMEISFVPQEAGTFKSLITAEQRGGKIFTLPVVADAVMPQVSIVENEFNFGVVYFGANRKLPLTIVNSGPVQAQVVFDFAEHPLFSLSLSQEQWENAEEYSESPLQIKGCTGDSGVADASSRCAPIITLGFFMT